MIQAKRNSMFPKHLILLISSTTPEIASVEQLIKCSAKFNEFARIDVWTLTSEYESIARYRDEKDKYFVVSCNETDKFEIEARFPYELWESGEFEEEDLAFESEEYQCEIEECIENGFNSDFNPVPKIWTAENLSQGIYSRDGIYAVAHWDQTMQCWQLHQV